MEKKAVLLCILLGVTLNTFLYSQEYLNEGLFFSSHEVTQEKRTSLNLTPEEPFHLTNGFNLKFKSKFRDKDGYFGNIVKIIGNGNQNIGLVANVNPDEKTNFWLTVNDSILTSFEWNDIPNGGLNKWIDFELDFDIPNSSISLSINGEKTNKLSKELSGLNLFEIVFGKSTYINAFINDVCPMSIKHIEIRDDDGKLLRNWILGKHTRGNKVFDQVKKDVAIVQNPTWLIDEHLYWKNVKSFQFDELIGTAKDELHGRIFMVDKKAIYVYSLKDQQLDTLFYKGTPFPCVENTLIYNPHKDELWSYSFDESEISKFDFSNTTWSLDNLECTEPEYWHHNKMISPKDSSLITFGGYGFYTYKSELKTFNEVTSKWTSINKRKEIDPRYLSASGILNNDKFLLFGGHGTKSGKQIANIKHYYDLYSINFDNYKVDRLWQRDTLFSTPMVPVESMVVNSSLDCFYTMVYNNGQHETYLKLARFGIDEFDMTVFPDSIPHAFENSSSRADFLLNRDGSKLVTILTSHNKINLHSLAYPPVQTSDVYQEDVESSSTSTLNFLWKIVLFALVGIGVFLLLKRRRKTPELSSVKEVVELKKSLLLRDSRFERRTNSSIYLFGGFQAFDKDGNDITALFTPTLKQLFILILLYQSKNEKGISSNKLTELLWYDKIETSARNNRNVNISKLRILLEKIGDIRLVNDNTYWTVLISDDVFCDYDYAKNQLGTLRKGDSNEEIYKFLKIVSAGEICPDIQTEWMDVFKVSIENQLIDGLEQLSLTQTNSDLLILIADTILKYAPLNEEAIGLKCRSLYNMGKKGLAKKSYDAFCNEYKNLLETKFEIPFGELIH